MPLFTTVTLAHEATIADVTRTIRSVTSQSNPDWEWQVIDCSSLSSRAREVFSSIASRDPRIKLRRYAFGCDHARAFNEALRIATGEFVARLDLGDVLHHRALEMVAEVIEANPETDYVYTDEDKIDSSGRKHDPFFKPDWSPERLRAHMYLGALSVFRRSLAIDLGGYQSELEASCHYDLAFRITEQARRISHVPYVLYHRKVRRDPLNAPGLTDVSLSAARAIQDHCKRTGVEGQVEPIKGLDGYYSVTPRLARHPSVSIIIPTAGSSREIQGAEECLVERCVASLQSHTSYPNFEIVVVTDTGVSRPTLEYLKEIAPDNLSIVPYDRPFNYSDKINTGVQSSSNDILVFLNDDIETISDDWLSSLVMNLQIPQVGAVGARLLFADGRVQHAGVGLFGSGPGHLFRGVSEDYSGYFGSPRISANLLAVTGACAAVSREVFEQVGGLSLDLPTNYNDIDFCLKIVAAGHRVVYEPRAELLHHESATRAPGAEQWELDRFLSRWEHVTGHDPYMNANLIGGNLL